MLAFVRDGDTVIVHSMDRLARNLDDLRRIVRSLTGKGVRVEFAKESLAFTGDDSPMATLLLSVMGAFAEFERLDPRTPARGHRRRQTARRLHRAQTRFGPGRRS
jgi:DNA invertase Pin-like site-specific DNA recombinase